MHIQPHMTVTVNDERFRMIPEEAFLSLCSLARQVRGRVKIVKNRVVPLTTVEEEHIELALKALHCLEMDI